LPAVAPALFHNCSIPIGQKRALWQATTAVGGSFTGRTGRCPPLKEGHRGGADAQRPNCKTRDIPSASPP
jgi:hypothetical protein